MKIAEEQIKRGEGIPAEVVFAELEKNMVIRRQDKYKIIILPIAQEEFDNIYKYIYKELFATKCSNSIKK